MMKAPDKLQLRVIISAVALLTALSIGALLLFSSAHDELNVALEQQGEGRAVLHITGHFARAGSISLVITPPAAATYLKMGSVDFCYYCQKAVRIEGRTIILAVTSQAPTLPPNLADLEFSTSGKVKSGDFRVECEYAASSNDGDITVDVVR
jgi:hypothetical protein